MRRRSLLAAIPATALAALACSDGGGSAIVKIATKSTGSRPAPIVITPTPVPPPELIASAENVYQGGALLLSLVGQVTDGAVTLLDRTRPLSQGSQSIYAFVGVGTDDPPGPHDLKIAFTLASGSKGTLTARANILRTAWTLDSIVVSDKLAALLDPRLAADETTILNGIYSKVTNEKLWTGAWNQPVAGAVTTRFGEERSYNGSPPGGHHSGTDIGAPAGAPVLATNSGRVALARQLRLRGNMVAVDHGGPGRPPA